MTLKMEYLVLLTQLLLLLLMLKKEVKIKIPNIATTALTVVENKIFNISNLVKKSRYNTKINEIEDKITIDDDHAKYIVTQKFNNSTSKKFSGRLALANLERESYIANFVQKTDFVDKLKKLDENVISNKTKHMLVENELN